MSEIINIYISSVIMIITIFIFGNITTDNYNYTKKNKLRTLQVIVIFSFLYALIFITLSGVVKTLAMCFLYTFFLYILFYKDIIKSIFTTIIYAIIMLLPELIVLSVSTELFNVSKDACHENIAGSILGNILISLLMIAITYILKKPLKKLISYNLSTNKKIILVSTLTLVSLAIFFYKLINVFRLDDNVLGYLVVIITLIVILFYLFKQKIDNDVILKKYDDLLNIMKTYESDIEEQRTMIHETRNELMTIKSKINDKVKETEIIKYIDSIVGDKTSSNMSKYSKFKYLPSNGIKGFFYYKFMEAEKRNIKVSVNISKKIEDSFLGKLDTKNFKDLVRIIGVYLDNAIEASAESEDKKLGIEIYLIKNDIEIIISNTFNNDINPEKIGKEKFTTKGKNHGHGLLLVKHILHNNSIFEVSSKIVNGLYVQTLKIKK